MFKSTDSNTTRAESCWQGGETRCRAQQGKVALSQSRLVKLVQWRCRNSDLHFEKAHHDLDDSGEVMHNVVEVTFFIADHEPQLQLCAIWVNTCSKCQRICQLTARLQAGTRLAETEL